MQNQNARPVEPPLWWNALLRKHPWLRCRLCPGIWLPCACIRLAPFRLKQQGFAPKQQGAPEQTPECLGIFPCLFNLKIDSHAGPCQCSVTVKQGLVQQGFVSVGFFANLFLSFSVFFCLFLSFSVFFCLFLAFVIWVVTFSLLMTWGAPAPNTKDQSCSMLGWISLRIRHCPLLLCLVLRGIGCCCCCRRRRRCCCCRSWV